MEPSASPSEETAGSKEPVDLDRLRAYAGTIGWSLEKLSAVIGAPIEAEMRRETKLMMRDIIAMNDVRFLLTVYQKCFPEATITEIQHRRQP